MQVTFPIRNHSIDLLKFVCAVLVVFLHTEWRYRDMILPFTRCAVPCFLMTSGFLLYNDGKISCSKIKRNVVKILKITIWATLLFLIFKECLFFVANKSVYIPSLHSIVNWVLFNECPFAYHLWYLYAYIYVLLVILLFERFNRLKFLFLLTPFLLVCDLILGKYGMVILGIDLQPFYIRNWIFVGVPYFCLGCIIKHCVCGGIKISKLWAVLGVCLFTLTTYLERFFIIQSGFVLTRDHYLSSTFLAVSLFWLIIDLRISKENFITKIGRQESIYIYILHPMILTICSVVSVRIGWENYYRDIAPVLVLCFTFLLIYALRLSKIIK